MTMMRSQPATSPRLRKLLPLQPGDRLTRAEFERRWDAMPQLKNAELINGVVYMAAALRIDQHGEPHARFLGWLSHYVGLTPGLRFGDNSSMRLDEDNVPQPDAVLFLPPHAGGQCRVDQDGYIDGAPEFVAEIAASSASYDLHDKLDVYRRHGVREYVVWRVLDEAIDWFIFAEGRFEPLPADDGGVYRSRVVPGLWLDAAAMIKGDLKRVFETVAQGAQGPEHAALVQRLAQTG